MKSNKITVVSGQACIEKAGVITCGGETYEVKDIIIATGSKVSYPPIPGIAPAWRLEQPGYPGVGRPEL